MRTKTWTIALLITAATACSGTNSGNPTASAPASGGTGTAAGTSTATATAGATSAAPARAYDPPLRFDTGAGWPLPPEAGQGKFSDTGGVFPPMPVALHGSVAYVAAPDGLQVVAPGTGKVTTIRPKDEPLLTSGDVNGSFVGSDPENPTTPPLVVDAEGRSLVLAAFTVRIPGHGTTPQHLAAELVAVDATTNDVAWRTDLDLPASAKGYEHNTALIPNVVGQHGGTVVLDVGHLAFGIDLATHGQRWRQQGVRALFVAGQTAVGTTVDALGDAGNLVGLNLADGRRLWRGPGSSYSYDPQPVGPRHVLWPSENWAPLLLDTSAGRPATVPELARLFNGDTQVICGAADDSLTLCHTIGELHGERPVAMAIDSTTGTVRWKLPASGRVAPLVTAVFDGAVYGTTENGPVVLDARTGADKEDNPGVAPLVVNQYVGVARGESGDLMAYRTSG